MALHDPCGMLNVYLKELSRKAFAADRLLQVMQNIFLPFLCCSMKTRYQHMQLYPLSFVFYLQSSWTKLISALDNLLPFQDFLIFDLIIIPNKNAAVTSSVLLPYNHHILLTQTVIKQLRSHLL